MNETGKSHVLVVDDEKDMREGLVDLLITAGYHARGVGSAEDALAELIRGPVDAVLTDMRMDGMGGLELLDRIQNARPEVPVIVITAYSSVETAVEAMQRGAFHYVAKPFKVDQVRLVVERAVRQKRLADENRYLRRVLNRREHEILGDSRAMQSVRDMVRRAAASSSTVLVAGETGTGKELVARAIHRHSPRTSGPFVPVNCAALPEGLLEAELFGHARGAFTGALEERQGLVEAADRGTLFLDEVGDLPMAIQAAFLRFIEDGEIRRVGETSSRRVDVRIVAATHRDLESRVEQGMFRQDLYFRLNVLAIRVPPLRERIEDLPLLARNGLSRVASQIHRQPPDISTEAMAALCRYSWPGNVRELENTLERAAILAPGDRIGPDDLPTDVVPAGAPDEAAELVTLAEVERRHILRVLKALGGRRGEAARVLQISRRTLYRKLLEWGVQDQIDE